MQPCRCGSRCRWRCCSSPAACSRWRRALACCASTASSCALHPPALAFSLSAWCVSLATILYFSAQQGSLSLHAWLIVIFLSLTVPVTTTLAGAHRVVSPAPQRGGLWRHARGAEPAGQPHTGRGAGSRQQWSRSMTLAQRRALATMATPHLHRIKVHAAMQSSASGTALRMAPHRPFWLRLAVACMGLVLAGCGSLPRNAPPAQDALRGTMPDFPDVRGWAGQPSSMLEQDLAASFAQESLQDFPPGRRRHGALRPPGAVRRRRQRRVRRGLPERLVQHRHAAGVQDRHRRVHRRADGALRLHRARLRPGAARVLHHHQHARHLPAGLDLRRCCGSCWPARRWPTRGRCRR